MVYAIAQDTDGFMWFGTQDGLNRFDGYDFRVHAPSDEAAGTLADEAIRALLLADDGTLWVATDAGGLSSYDATTERFTTFRADGDPGSLESDRVRTLFEDSHGTLWIGTDGAGLARFDATTGRFEHFRHNASVPGSLSDDHVWDIAEDQIGALWVATTRGLNRLAPGSNAFERFFHDPADPTSITNDEVRALVVDRQDNLWIGTSAGLNRIDGLSGEFERFVASEEDPFSISADRINALFEDRSGVLWVGTVNGLNAWNAARRRFEPYLSDSSDPLSLPHDTVMSIYQDRAGVLWVGSYAGVSRWNPATRLMRHYHESSNEPTSLAANTTTAFAEDAAGNIVVGTFGGGINILDRASGNFEKLRQEPDNPDSLSSDWVMALHYDRAGNLWAGTRADGLNRIDGETGRIDHFVHDPDDPQSLSSNTIARIVEDKDGGIWIATFGGGLSYFDGERFTQYRHDPDDPNTLSSDRILVLHQEANGGLWAGTYASGLNYLDPVTKEVTRYTADPADDRGLVDNGITMITENRAGDLWIGVKGGGLHVWRQADRSAGRAVFERYTEKDGLPDATIYSGQWDAAGRLWLSTGRGLSQVDTASMTFRNFDTSHGLQGDDFNLNAGFRANNGELFFGGMKGFNAFQPAWINAGGPPPDVAITRVSVLNETLDPAAYRQDGAPVEFRHDQNVIGLEFAALDFAAPEYSRYQYRLDNADPEWVDAGKRRQVSYANLPAGDYVFRVRAVNNNGVWSETESALAFTVLQAPWATVWAYAMYALLITACFAIVVRWQARRARETEMVRHAEHVHRLQGRLANAQQIAALGNWEWNLKTGSMWWSDQLFRLLKLSPAEVTGNYDEFLERVHPDDRKSVDGAIQRAINNGDAFALDHRVVWPDGSIRFVSERGECLPATADNPACLAVTMHDISDRKAAEDALRRHAGFHELLAGFSARLLNAEATAVDAAIVEGFGQIGEHCGIDEIVIRWFSGDKATLKASTAWSRAEGGPTPNGIETWKIPWAVEQLLAGRQVVVEDIDAFPVDKSDDEKLFRRLGYQSLLMVPLSVDGKLTGTCQFSTRGTRRRWPEEMITDFTLACDALTSALARQCAMSEVTDLKDQLQAENLYLREEVKLASGFSGIIGEDRELKRCLRAVEKVAPTDVPVLVLGETGTGKELIARAIHKLSARADGPMVSVNCPALPGSLIESELFGHEKGAFTGADSRRMGRFELAEGGTIFLDEIGELPLDLQAKLLRVLQTGEFQRLGGTKTQHANVRLVAATNRNLPERIKAGEFRADLYFRISSFPIRLPALRDRKGDVSLLAEHFVHKHAERLNRDVSAISARFLKQLEAYDWPGNIRELESAIERALISCADRDVLDLDEPLYRQRQAQDGYVELKIREDADLADMERTYILTVLDRTDGRIAGSDGAAEALGVPASTLRSKMKKLGIERFRTA